MQAAEQTDSTEVSAMRAVRLNFSKTGRAIYISHLDINRMMTRAVRRAKLPMWYTEGFNPHPYLTFALPLSLGQSSDCEYMDIRIEGGITDEEIMNRLNAVLPEGVKILSVSAPVYDAKEIEKALYFVKLVFKDAETSKSFAERAQTLAEGEELLAERPGTGALNIQPRFFKPIVGGDYKLTVGFKSDDSEKLYGMGQYQQRRQNINVLKPRT